MTRRNLILQTDSYKLTHHDMLPPGTSRVFSYLEARAGGDHDRVLWFGLQYYLREYLAGAVVTEADIAEARALVRWHLSSQHAFNEVGWRRIVDVHGGRLPLRIRPAPEGSIVPTGNVLMTVENTDPQLPWLTNAVESLLLKAWYPTTVATVSWHVKQAIIESLEHTGGDPAAADFMLQDFGYRGVSSEESAAIGGMAHLVNFRGSDTLQGIQCAREYYGAPVGVASSVTATEHSVMTALGRGGEHSQALRILSAHPNEIVSLVADSYDYYRFVDFAIAQKDIVDRQRIRLVLRPDSMTPQHPLPEDVVAWTLSRLDEKLGSTRTATGHKVVPYGVLWGDGLGPADIKRILLYTGAAGFAAQNLVFGMGGGLLQKVNRDTDRFAIKCSAQEQDGSWHDVRKEPLQASKASKAGRLKLVYGKHDGYRTVREEDATWDDSILEPVFEDGLVLRQETFVEVRQRAALQSVGASLHPAAAGV